MTCHPRQLQRKFKHALDFGVTGNYNPINATAFEVALQKHVSHLDTQVLAGTYRGKPATFYINPNTRLTVIEDAGGNFVSGWKLSKPQFQHVRTHGKLN
jgi:hypothetical protein